MPQYDPAVYSRILTSLTLGFHIIFATIGVGVPLMIALAEWMGIKRNDPHYTLLARRWARGFVITVAVGVVTGTSIGIQLSLLWPSFMRIAGQAIALPLFMETFAFFVEAIFLGIYLYTWDRFKKPIYHFWLSIPIILGSSGSAMFITMMNSFMNAPAGFTLEDGKITNIQPILAMLNPATPTKVSHVLFSAYLTCAFILAGIAAYSILKGRKHVYYKKALKLTMTTGLIFAIGTAVVGDLSGKYLAEYQPEKLAAAEWHFETIEKAPLILGGILTEDNEVKFGLQIPYALSILAHGTPNAVVKGLNEYKAEDLPPLYIHYLFDAMVAIGMFLMLLTLLYFILRKWRKGNPHHRLLLWAIVIAAPLSVFAIEFGWVFSEVGRQPWILRGFMRTNEGATTSEHVDIMLYLFLLLYLVLGIAVSRVLRTLFRNNPAEAELLALEDSGADKR
ncbi:cytochrome D ubiquinol oxidase subunit I [Paenibacillus swuensis]|uniref:Cytochrome D ubiquinol oxidase subunit I n=1 Tax=Paenibacillus swuensis TaxID=1178515 RepID=A0A172TNF5_9BACL|nr:cytochrome ubiquinol oxidase subunit I [Paenibacillus swuensis]ANE48424.1 cytochrome D ubiquinol oxidase subunit I [Paenibacillus swuensis]